MLRSRQQVCLNFSSSLSADVEVKSYLGMLSEISNLYIVINYVIMLHNL